MSDSTSFLRLSVGFILTVTGVLASCPLKLSPPRTVVKYGESVSINCSTSASDFLSMGWEAPQGGSGLQYVNHITWTVENLTDWDISTTCFINLRKNSAFSQCEEKPEVVLYKFPEHISIISSGGPDGHLEENKEYSLTCLIQGLAPVRNLTIELYKEDSIYHKETFDIFSKKPTDQLLTYRFTATRKEINSTFRCEAHMDLGPEGPQLNLSSPKFDVTVLFGPDIQCETSGLQLEEGETLNRLCPVEGNPPPTVTWMKDGEKIDPNIPRMRNDSGQYVINAEGVTFVSKEVKVDVWYSPESNCLGSYTVFEGDLLPNCTFEGNPQPKVTWYKDDVEVEFLRILTRHDAGQYLITASNNVSSVNWTIDIFVTYPPSPIVELEDLETEVGSTVSLKCSSRGFPQPKYSWNYFRTANVEEINEDGVSFLLIHEAAAQNMGSYTCHAINKRGNVSKTVTVTVKGATQECPITFDPPQMVIQYHGSNQSATCNVMPSAVQNLKEKYWENQNRYMVIEDSLNMNPREDWFQNPKCFAAFEGNRKCNKSLPVTLYKPPDSVSITYSNNSSLVELKCNIIRVAPSTPEKLSVRWYRGNNIFEPHHKGTLQVMDGEPSDIKVVNVSATINITRDRMHFENKYRCEAWIDLRDGTTRTNTTSSPLNVIFDYKPQINTTKFPKVIPVWRGYPEDLVCEAYGNPPPEIMWLCGKDKGSCGSEKKLIVSEAGLYNCTATNKLGSDYYVVQVILKEDYLPLIAGFVAVTVVAISIVFVFIYSIYYKNTKMRRYSLKNPKLSTHNGNVAHNGWESQFPMTKLS